MSDRPTAISSDNICKATKGIGGRSEANFLTCQAPVSVKADSHHYRVLKRTFLTFWRYFNQLKGVRNLGYILHIPALKRRTVKKW
jgi:hypothetical protein